MAGGPLPGRLHNAKYRRLFSRSAVIGWGLALWRPIEWCLGRISDVDTVESHWSQVITAMHQAVGLITSPAAYVITLVSGLSWLAWLVTRREEITSATEIDDRPTSDKYRIILQEPWFVRDQKEATVYKSKLVVSLTNSGNKPIRFQLPSWISNKGDVGLQTPFCCGYWIYPEGQTEWVDATDPMIEPTERFHIWIGLDQACPDKELKNRSLGKRLGTLRIPMEVEGEKRTVEYRL
jgi:hypothetical protein